MKSGCKKAENGSALIISLVILTAITMGAMVAMQRSSVQIRMVTNLQHEQEVDSAALSTLNYVYDSMVNKGALQTKILTTADNLYKQALADGETAIPTFDPFTTFSSSMQQPSLNLKSVRDSDITTRIQALPVPAGSGFYLKGKAGCGSGCSVLHAAVITTAQSKNNVITSTQEYGIRRLTPGAAG